MAKRPAAPPAAPPPRRVSTSGDGLPVSYLVVIGVMAVLVFGTLAWAISWGSKPSRPAGPATRTQRVLTNSAPAGSYAIVLTPVLANDVLTLTGKTNLPDGADLFLGTSIPMTIRTNRDPHRYPSVDLFESLHVTVSQGAFKATAHGVSARVREAVGLQYEIAQIDGEAILGWDNVIRVSCTFTPRGDKQPAAVYSLFGRDFERLQGPDVEGAGSAPTEFRVLAVEVNVPYPIAR